MYDQIIFNRLENKVDKSSGCWLWLGEKHKAYGRTEFAGQRLGAHRLMYHAANGPIPEGLMVLHRCDVPLCINPDHLFIGTQLDNMRDMSAKGRGRKPKPVYDGDNKLCSGCKQMKHTSHYWRDAERSDGLQIYCHDCKRIIKSKTKR